DRPRSLVWEKPSRLDGAKYSLIVRRAEIERMRRGISSRIFVGTVVALLLAALAEGVYFDASLNQSNNLTPNVSQLISPTTTTLTRSSTVTSTQTLFTSGAGPTSVQTVTVTST